jgi:hypothetical protein
VKHLGNEEIMNRPVKLYLNIEKMCIIDNKINVVNRLQKEFDACRGKECMFFSMYHMYVMWEEVLSRIAFPTKFVEEFAQNLTWNEISCCQKLMENDEFVRKNVYKLNLKFVSRVWIQVTIYTSKNLVEQFSDIIKKFRHDVDWKYFTDNVVKFPINTVNLFKEYRYINPEYC